MKKILLTTLIALSFASITASNDRINAIKSTLAHIAQAKKDILAEKEEIKSINKKVKEQIHQKACGHMVDVLHYEEHIKILTNILNSITARDDFQRVIDHSTDFQVRCIVDKQINYNDIIYSQEAYPIEQKTLIHAINEVIANPSLTRYTNHQLIFDVYYLEATQTVGYKLLLEKLNLKAQDLKAELAALEADC
jgi:hypothetical protein